VKTSPGPPVSLASRNAEHKKKKEIPKFL